jgi:hypothetical protein
MKSEGPSIGKVGECAMASQHLQGCSPRLCWLRTDGLTPTSKYWTYRLHASDMGLVSLVACHQQVPGWEVKLGALFLRSSASIQPCWWLVKGCYTWTTWDTYGRGPYADRAWKACGVLVGFSSTRCTSIQIIVTLRYKLMACGSLHVANQCQYLLIN